MELINNTSKTLRDDLSVEIKQGSKLSIAAACFSIYAFEELKKELKGIDELRFIFTSPTFTTEKTIDYLIINPNTGVAYNPPSGRSWITNKDTMQNWIVENKVFFGQNGQGAPQLKRYLNEVQNGVVPTTYWSYDDCGHNDEAKMSTKIL